VAGTQFERRARSPRPPTIDLRSLWTGGVATAVVAALVAVVGVLIVRGVFKIPVIAPGNTDGVVDYVGAVWLAFFAMVGGLLATALAQVLLLLAPRPMAYFGWIVGLITLAFAIWPYTVRVGSAVQFANAALYLVIGIAVGTLVSLAAGQAVRPDGA
jgi:hypothetical protein